MTTPPPTQQPEKRPWYQEAWYHFKHSNYVTWFTDWLLTLGGKSAQSVLIGTTLYMSAELYPGIHLPPTLSIAVFIIQMFALDMGGMGLATLARQARADGNEQGADKAQLLSQWLIGIMIAGIVTVCVEQAISNFKLSADAQNWINAIKIMIEVSLVVARAFCAVLYGVVIHALHADRAIQQQEQQDLSQQNERLQSTVADLEQQLSDYQHQATAMQVQMGSALGEIEQLQRDLTLSQQQNGTLTEELQSGQGGTATLRKQLSAALTEVDMLKGHLEDRGRSLDQLQQRLTVEQQRSVAIAHELEAGQGDTTSLRKQLGAVLSEAEMLRAALSSKSSEVESLKGTLAGSSEHLRQQLEAEQSATILLRKDLQSAKLQVVDLTGQLAEVTHRVEKLQNAEGQVKDLSAKLGQRERECAAIQVDLSTAKAIVTDLQNAVDQTANLPGLLQEKEEELAVVLAELQSAKQQVRDLQKAQRGSAKSSDQSANSGKITSIEAAKSNRVSHAEVIAFMEANPMLKRAEVAANLGISERKVYDAVAWGKEQAGENAVAH